MSKKENMERGVYYDRADYASFGRRILVWAIDLTVILAILYVYCYVNFYSINDSLLAFKISFFGSLLISYVYLAILKSSTFGTLGFRVADVKIVDLQGNKPSWSTMLTRFLLLAIGPFSLILDILWLTGEQTKQTLRDKYMETYVVRKNSKPKGTGKFRKISLDFVGWHLVFREVVSENNMNE